MYRSCSSEAGLEIRVDPGSSTRLLWYSLDRRFVRFNGDATSGSFDVSACEGARCAIGWETDGVPDSDPIRELTVWSGPTAMAVEADDFGTLGEWLRVAD
jgi:hypothetical protein